MNINPITFVTVSHGHYDYIKELIESILEHWHSKFELVIVDNLATGQFEHLIKDYESALKYNGSSIELFSFDSPKSFSVGNNFAINKANHEDLFIINPDCKFIDDSVYCWFKTQKGEQLAGRLNYPRLLNSDGTVQQSFNEWPSFPNQLARLIKAKLGYSTGQKQHKRDWYFASAIITTRQTFHRLHGFDELFPLYCEDVDLCYKASLIDVPCHYIETVQMIHHLGGEAKHKHLAKAVQSNLIWRYVRLRNYIKFKVINSSYENT